MQIHAQLHHPSPWRLSQLKIPTSCHPVPVCELQNPVKLRGVTAQRALGVPKKFHNHMQTCAYLHHPSMLMLLQLKILNPVKILRNT